MWHLKRRVFLLFLSAETLIVAAQVPLTLPTNALRHGDALCKIQMPYVAPGNVGEGEVWHLGTVSDDYPDFMQEINSNGDTIAVYEAERIQHYVVRGDTLLDKGEPINCLCPVLQSGQDSYNSMPEEVFIFQAKNLAESKILYTKNVF